MAFTNLVFAFSYLNVLLVTLFTSFGVVLGSTGTALSVCAQTPHPEVCTSLMGKGTEETTFDIHKTTLETTLAQAVQAHELFSAMDLSSFEPRAKSAWADCLELYQDSVYQLNRSVASSDVNDIQTWLSAAATNQETCKNGFHDLHVPSYIDLFPSSINQLSKYLSNSLAINKAIGPVPISSKKIKGRRLLVDDGFPQWLSRSDRKLLQSTGGSADIVVAQDGSGNYKTISEAVAAAAKGGGKRLVIHVKAGVYKENVDIKRSTRNLMFVGDGIGSTVVTGNKNVQDGSTTFRSATFAVSGSGFIAMDMTFENTAGPGKHQAVAFRSGSDLSVCYRCAFKGYQDTLYFYNGRQFYRDCQIYGTQDFMFGNGVAVVQNSVIYVRKPMGGQQNTVTAQARTDPNQNTGIIVHNSAVTAASDLKGSEHSYRTYLGRPWQKYSRTVFMKTNLDGLIDPAGWLPWSGNFALSTCYYAEHMNTGAGASTSGRVKWPGYHVISATEASKFTVGNFLSGGSWIGGAGVPYTSGL